MAMKVAVAQRCRKRSHSRDGSNRQYTRFFGGNTDTSLVRVRIFTGR